MTDRRVIAVIPAAGRGRRMGQLKQLLPIGGSTMMETVIATAVGSAVDGVVVVVNEAVRAVAERHASDRCRVVLNPDPDSDMLKSVQIGWKVAVEAFGHDSNDGILVVPADQPEVSGASINEVTAVYKSQGPNRQAVIATYAGKRGHPAVYPGGWIAETESWPAGLGLNELAKRHPMEITRVAQSGALPTDVNTPAEYQKASEIHKPG